MEIKQFLTGEVLVHVDADTLANADFSGVDLKCADFVGRDLHGADFSGARLSYADFSESNLQGADFAQARLNHANLRLANLSEANLVGADLTLANLSMADLTSAMLSKASFGGTVLSFCGSLGDAFGLSEVEHNAPSTLGLPTLRDCFNDLPPSFLKGVGLSDLEIQACQRLYRAKSNYCSCHILHGECDREYARQLRSELLAHDIPCWPASFGNDPARSQSQNIVAKTFTQDKIIVVGSHAALVRNPDVRRIEEAVRKDVGAGAQKLYLVMLDDYLLSNEFLSVARDKKATRQWAIDWVAYARRLPVYNVKQGQHPRRYNEVIGKLAHDLRYSPTRLCEPNL